MRSASYFGHFEPFTSEIGVHLPSSKSICEERTLLDRPTAYHVAYGRCCDSFVLMESHGQLSLAKGSPDQISESSLEPRY